MLLDVRQVAFFTGKPPLFTKGEELFWDDPHISKQMLDAHLNPSWEAASRKPETIDASVEWITRLVPDRSKRILDLGCGPGLYCSRLAEQGYDVTGIDYSRRSIDYATDYAQRHSLDVSYIYQNYLTIDYENAFDVILLIYCDLGALTDADRDVLLEKVYRALRPGGLFLFDVFTDKRRDPTDLRKDWEVAVNGGFWSPNPYIALSETFFYPQADTYLDQIVVATGEGQPKVYRIYDHIYTKESIGEVLSPFGFKDQQYFQDVLGQEYFRDSETLCVVTKKQEG